MSRRSIALILAGAVVLFAAAYAISRSLKSSTTAAPAGTPAAVSIESDTIVAPGAVGTPPDIPARPTASPTASATATATPPPSTTSPPPSTTSPPPSTTSPPPSTTSPPPSTTSPPPSTTSPPPTSSTTTTTGG